VLFMGGVITSAITTVFGVTAPLKEGGKVAKTAVNNYVIPAAVGGGAIAVLAGGGAYLSSYISSLFSGKTVATPNERTTAPPSPSPSDD